MLLLTADISNSVTALALWPLPGPGEPTGPAAARAKDGPPALRHWQLSSVARTGDELALLVSELLERSGVGARDVTAAIVSCVVPELARPFAEVCLRLFGVAPRAVEPGLRSGIAIRTEDPRELGPDRLANAVAALARYGAPSIVLDFGTALTVDLVDPEGHYVGALIAPGPDLAAEALARRTARLGRVVPRMPERAIGSDTESALQSGLIFGYAGLIEGLLEAAREAVGRHATVVATGDIEAWGELLDLAGGVDAREPLLTLDGLRRLHLLNA